MVTLSSSSFESNVMIVASLKKRLSLSLIVALCCIQAPTTFASKKAVNCKKNPLYCHIIKLQPNMNKSLAMRLSNHLFRYAKQHQLDPWRSLAIAMQESSLRKTKRHSTVIVPVLKCNTQGRCQETLKTIRGISDLGLFQLHADTIKHYQFDADKLTKDIDYMVKTHFIVLIDKIKQCKRLGPQAWSCYHSKTPVLRKRYIQKVNRYYKKVS